MGLKFLSCLSFIFLLVLFIASEANGGYNNQCFKNEKHVLLKLKAGVQSIYTRRLDSWNIKGHDDDDDCCKWSGVECSNITGHITGLDLSHSYKGCMIDPSLHELQYLSYLDLSGNDHQHCQIPAFFGNLTKLVQLDLSDSGFKGRIPHQLGNLSMLEFLDLSENFFNGSGIPESLGFLKKLIHLDIHYSEIGGRIPYQLRNLSRLQYLNLNNNYLAYVDNLEWASHLDCLTYLYLEGINLSGAVDWVQTIMNLPKLIGLDFFDSSIPDVAPPYPAPKNTSSSLSIVDLSYNELTSSIFEWIFNFSSNLSRIYLHHNSLTGPIPDAFGKMPSLISLDLSANELEGDIPTSLSCACSSLKYLRLNENRLKANLSNSINCLHKLKYLDLSLNSFYGTISQNHLNNFSSLHFLILDYNFLTLRLSPQWIPPFQLLVMSLRSCILGPQFPGWLKSQTSLHYLDISSSQISGATPDWFWNLSSKAEYLNISYNEISSTLPSELFSQIQSGVIDLSSNLLEGRIPLFNSQLEHINLSKNKFSGSLSSLCQLNGEWLQWLDLSNNSLSGKLPNCLKKKRFGGLSVIILSNNNFSGRILNICSSPDHMLSVLQLRNNNFSGQLPSSLSNYSQLELLDVADNMISGSIPEWIGDHLPSLKILILRSNRFSGKLPSNLCWLQSIQIVDISLNNISGSIPDCLGNLFALTNKTALQPTASDNYRVPNVDPIENVHFSFHWYYGYMYSDKLVWKGNEYEFLRSLLYMKFLDFSSNNLQGEIPEEFGSLVELQQLNLSSNNLSGNIPHKIGEMKMLEVLDLSSNHLSGGIPQSITTLSFLGSLDLSNNNLTGKIPTGTQLQTQSAASYMGNPGLCGDPLPKKCHREEAAPPPLLYTGGGEEEEEGFISKGFYISMGVGFVIAFWGMLGPLLFRNSWSFAYFRFLNTAADWVYVRYTLTIAKIQTRWAR